MEVIVDANDVIKNFKTLPDRVANKVMKGAINKGARIVAIQAGTDLMHSFSKQTQKVMDMANSIGYKYHKEDMTTNVFTVTNAFYYSYMARWFIAGTKERYMYERAHKRSKHGGLTKRLFRIAKKHHLGKLEGNEIIVKAMEKRKADVDKTIGEEIIKGTLKQWQAGQ